MSYKITSVILFSLMLLSACNQTQPPENGPMNYQTDPRILRGTWAGENEDGVPLKLNLRTKDPSTQEYFFSGTFKLGDASPLSVGGQVLARLSDTSLSPNQQAGALPCEKNVRGVVTNVLGAKEEFRYDICGTIPEGSPPEFRMTLIDRNGPEPVISEFTLTKQLNEPAPDFLVKGTITRLKGVPYTYDGDFVFTKDSHAIVLLYYSKSALGDAPEELLKEVRIENITSLPISFKLEGDAESTFEQFGDYYLSVGVFSGDGGEGGATFAVGDLVNENYTPVLGAGAEVNVEVTGLEPCPPPGVSEGGLCVPVP